MTGLDQLLDDVAARTPAPGAGAVAAHTASLAAALAEMVARFSDDDATAQACAGLRSRLAPLADDDAEAYERYLEAVRLPKSDPGRGTAMWATLSAATDVPLRMVEAAAEIAGFAARLARDGNPRLRGDAVTSALVAAGSAQSAAVLVAINMRRHEDDPRPAQAADLARLAQTTADEAATTFR